jgi:outer membrane murein-binding lipoprotein Lpp
VKRAALFAGILLAGCAANPQVATAPPGECRAEVKRLSALLAAETAERQRATRAAARREETLRRQLNAMKAIERGILEREERVRSETR